MPGAVDDDAAGVLMLKPGVVASVEAQRELATRLDDFGYELLDVRTIPFAVVRERGLLRRHYHDHFEVARAGRLLPAERARLVEIYDTPSFRRDHGDPATLEIVSPVLLAEAHGLAPSVIAAWSEDAAARYGIDNGHPLACNEVGELADVQLLPGGVGDLRTDTLSSVDRPCFVINPQMLSLASWWEDGPDDTVVARVRAAGAGARPWADVRAQLLGTGPPSRWPVGSIRRDMLDGRSAVRYRDGIAMGVARNGVHLSNGPIEALRELTVWFDRAPEETVIGRVLRDAGLDPAAVLDAVYVEDGTGVHPISQRTAHLDPAEVVEALRGARLLRADET